ncbi:MAG TPA: glycosyltransferase family 39 protein [Candidatus Acidoferrales bacterium]|nr:glycosyltransferase family 39 protein [Candidatus Acidoferrales bacterium]
MTAHVLTGSEPRSLARHRASVLAVYGCVMLGIVARMAYIDRPFDHRLVNPWRQSDYLQVTRNFQREGMNILYPRIDWRGDTPGYAEMELPVLPWLGAALYRVVGAHAQVLRALAGAFEIASLLLFTWLARRLLPPVGAGFAVAAFALSPLPIILASAIQPEPVMHFFSLVALALLWRWRESPRCLSLLGAAAAAAIAILCKLPALYLGLVFAYVVIRKLGTKALADYRVYLASLIAVLPACAWYVWAYHFWTQYGNSLGLSNEGHYLGWDLILPPRFLIGNLTWETVCVVTPIGWVLILAALRTPDDKVQLVLAWYAAAFIFYIVSARTTAERWAYYYHVLSVAPACLLMGAGIAAFADGRVIAARRGWAADSERRLGCWLGAGTLATLVFATLFLIHLRDARTQWLQEMRTCALQFASSVAPADLIVVRGGSMRDARGNPIAHNESMAFAFMDRKGFNYGDEELGIDTLDRIAARGGRYWMVNHDELRRDDLKRLVESHYRQVDTCTEGYDLYDLRGH